MKSNLLVSIFYIGLITLCSAEDKSKETKDKRQIGQHHTRINPQEQPDVSQQIEALFRSQSNQYLARERAEHGQAQRQQQQRFLHRHQEQPQQEQTQEAAGPEQYTYIQEIAQAPHQKPLPYPKISNKKSYPIAPQQYTQDLQYTHQQQHQQQQQPQPIQYISEDQLLKLLQDELSARGIEELGQKTPQSKPVAQKLQQNPGLGSYREAPVVQNPDIFSYVPQNINQQQQYFNQGPIDYHKSIPNHPLAESSFERELEKLVASNKPSGPQHHQFQQPEPYKAPKVQHQQQKAYASTPAPTIKPFSFLPDFAQFSAFKPTTTGFLQPQFNQPKRHYSGEISSSRQQEQKIDSGNDQNNGQYLTEIVSKPKIKPNHTPFQQQKSSQFYLSQNKQQYQSGINNDPKNGAVQIIPAPQLQYERPQPSPSPSEYYKNQEIAKSEVSNAPSRSSIYVSQGTGIATQSRPTPASSLSTKTYTEQQKLVRLPPQDGKPISQEEFQALVDAGYSVTAIPVPVHVPYEKYSGDQLDYESSGETKNTLRRQVKPVQNRHGITYLRPLQDVRTASKESS